MRDKIAVYCVAEESGASQWEAFCINFDLAVQGRSFDEVYQKLSDQIVLYLETVSDLPEAEREKFLSRGVPLRQRIGFVSGMIGQLFRASGSRERHQYIQPKALCHA